MGMRHITENQMLRLYELVPDYFESEWMLRRFFELFAEGKPEQTDKLVDMFVYYVTTIDSRPLDARVMRILVAAKNNLERLTLDIRQWLQYARYLRSCTKDSDKITPTEAGIDTSEKLIATAYECIREILKIIDNANQNFA